MEDGKLVNKLPPKSKCVRKSYNKRLYRASWFEVIEYNFLPSLIYTKIKLLRGVFFNITNITNNSRFSLPWLIVLYTLHVVSMYV